ncbi:hypothetical protein K470DRAFT_151834 [Piedraia hortae CBS 480.64]|uniref:Uncharacterized protein n=1 Tax=Piedraia hortae CBS 480.64 TaxID=1314780 RepID=A0A6A7BS66_9PEZI|nr:hypothetical protein K470DRAFT_151834 [Piedraia hortae CBS 480.64]
MEGRNFTSSPSGLIWDVQAITVAKVFVEETDQADRQGIFMEVCHRYLSQGPATPMSSLLRWRSYIRAATRPDISTNEAIWYVGQTTVMYKATRASMDVVRQLIREM